jgi:outer membrane murein-binding lipoprotein Lpp
MRVNRNGHFEILNNAGNAPILTVDDEGNAFVKHLIVNGGSVEAKIEELRSIISGLEAKVKELTKEPTN